MTLAAAVLRVPMAILEPNSVIGLANRLVAPFAKRAYVASEEAAKRFRVGVRRLYGVPLREGFVARPYSPRGTARILVMGGSQGAAGINERMPEAIRRLAHVPGLQVVHQSGRGREDTVRQAYANAGFGNVTVVPFLDDVARAIADCDLVVARAGASSLAEVTAVGRAAVFVPFPHAADDHQARNAQELVRVGAAVCVCQEVADASRLAAEMERLLLDDAARVAMADASRARGRPDAARAIAADLLALGGIDERPRQNNNGSRTGSLHREAC
jgi:UDP-N-acetylglucosamine--N-acetylmuramyl-(pentapeptide) pyrophosphoryl-undecaprenol N-acetylglucosamine transferase